MVGKFLFRQEVSSNPSEMLPSPPLDSRMPGGSTCQPQALDNQAQLGQEVSSQPPVSWRSSMHHQTAFLFAS